MRRVFLKPVMTSVLVFSFAVDAPSLVGIWTGSQSLAGPEAYSYINRDHQNTMASLSVEEALSIDLRAADATAVSEVLTTNDLILECRAKAEASGDLKALSETELRALRECVASALSALAERLITLKALLRRARFDATVLVRSADLVANPTNSTALSMRALFTAISSAQGAAVYDVEFEALTALNDVAQTVAALP